MNDEFEKLWTLYQNRLLEYIMDKVQNKYDAEDIFQEVFIKVNQSFYNISDKSSIQSYIYKAAKNTIIDYYRKKREIPIGIEGDISEEFISNELSDNISKEMAYCLRNILNDLPEKYQKPIKLYDIDGKKHKEVSKQLMISISGSKTRIQRGRQKLKKMLFKCCDFEFDAMGNVINYKKKNNDLCKKWCK
ncbi:MAG: RNA polymerase sigma factor SigZ [Bacillota bacterium]|nr:RNA polymerase sigma factor SigZ [Bacillota bacterium]